MPCSDSIRISSAARRASSEPSAKRMTSLGPAGRRDPILSASTRFAATNHGLPGPSIFRHFGIEAVPKAAAATACAPPALAMRDTPAKSAATNVAGSIIPSCPGGVRIIGSGTPATIAGIAVINVTDGNEPLPRGE